MAREGGNLLLFILYLLLGLYFINYGFQWINLPEFFSKIDKWIFVVGGGLLIFGSFKFLRSRKVVRR